MATGQVSDSWNQGDPYDRYVGRWSRRVAPAFLKWLQVEADRKWLDVGCGTGALCAAIIDQCAPALVVGVEPSPGFLAVAGGKLRDQALFYQGSAEAIPLESSAVDVAVSGLVLNFVPNPLKALEEMGRVAVNGATIGAYVWDYADKMELMRHFWDAAVELNPAVEKLDEGKRFPLCRPGPLTQLFSGAGFTRIDVTAIDVPTPFDSFDDYWEPFLGGQGPAPAYAMSLEEEARSRLRESIRARLPVRPDGSISLTARAWAIRATVAK